MFSDGHTKINFGSKIEDKLSKFKKDGFCLSLILGLGRRLYVYRYQGSTLRSYQPIQLFPTESNLILIRARNFPKI